MKFARRLSFVIYLILESHPAIAYSAIGIGNASCGMWTADRRNPSPISAEIDQSWVVGFLSGIGFVGFNHADPLAGTDAYGVWAWIDNYCAANPLVSIADASAAFFYAHPH